ncbi:DMT family transporter [Tardiphaga alba]|uniref:DMT family transporter n=1 Tax=Tardiphaga alba TaxID=340268 RepID=A0ABX8A5I6_9BRAD|nr:DMT family transporter [Tardiphaga alba]QUS38291.1 DMT family transporter [Tardiphaga alba]
MSAEPSPFPPGGRPLTVGAIALVLMLCLTWGFNQIAIKLVLREIPPYTQAALRSAGGLLMILSIAWFRGVKLFERDGTLKAGLFIGTIFGVEFLVIFHGLELTTASRAVVFLYTMPFFVAFGAYQLLGERLSAMQWGGLAVSFAGVAVAIGVPQPNVTASVLFGDLLMIIGAAMWAATTLIVKRTRLIYVTPEKALGYQVGLSIPILSIGALVAGERIPAVPSALSMSLLSFQAFWVVGLTFLLWFSLIKTHSASKLAAFTFITPLFGVVGGYLILGDQLTPVFGLAALLVIAGLVLVNRPARSAATNALLNVTKT